MLSNQDSLSSIQSYFNSETLDPTALTDRALVLLEEARSDIQQKNYLSVDATIAAAMAMIKLSSLTIVAKELSH